MQVHKTGSRGWHIALNGSRTTIRAWTEDADRARQRPAEGALYTTARGNIIAAR